MIEISDLVVNLGARTALDKVNLSVESGEFLGLIGPNGAGKTTLIRSILGLIPVESGTVKVHGSSTREATRHIGYVPQRQEFAWDFPISVEQVVMTGLVGKIGFFKRATVGDWKAVVSALAMVDLLDLRTRTVGELSGGQKQRVLVARALVQDPKVLLLDEPYTGLDLPTQEMLGELFLNLSRDGKSVIMATHDLVGALYACDKVALLNRTIIANETPKKLLDQPKIWAETFGAGSDSALIKILKLAAEKGK